MNEVSQLGEAAALERLENAEAQLSKLRDELEHFGRLAMIGTLAAGVAHEVNNRLTPALAHAQQLRAGNAADRERAADRVLEGIEASARILQAMLDFAAPEESRVSDVAAVLEATADCLGRDLQRDGITLERDVPPGIQAAIGPVSLQQVLMNLLINARKAMGGPGRIRVTAEPKPEHHVQITVADDGPGIPEAVRERLFEPFVTTAASGQGEDPHRSGRAGSGLGLWICRRTVEAVGGAISAENTAGGGAAFVLDLRSDSA